MEALSERDHELIVGVPIPPRTLNNRKPNRALDGSNMSPDPTWLSA